MKKSIVSMILTIAVFMTTGIAVFSAEESVTEGAEISYQSPIVATEDMGVQENACIAYENLMNSFPSSRATGEKIYPDYYGGSYINDEGKLVIYVTEGEVAPAVISDSDDVVYEECDYSYNELLNVMEELNSFKFGNPDHPVAKNFNEFGLYDAENRIIVKMDDLTEEEIEIFKAQVSDSTAIEFEQGNGPVQLEVNVNAGSSAYTSSATASVGYRVKRNGIVGFVTAGHFTGSGDTVYSDGVAFAICNVSQQSGDVDGAFCSITNSDYALTNTLSGTDNTLSTTISEPGVGTVINKIGQSTGHTSGTVTATSVTITFTSGNTISNLTAADYTSAFGDSGGVVYSYIGSTNTRLTLGIHTGSNGTTRYYTKANAINTALGTARY